MARKRKTKKEGTFVHYAIMGAGFAAGAAIISVAVTAATIGVNEAYKLVAAPKVGDAGGEALPGGGTGEIPFYG